MKERKIKFRKRFETKEIIKHQNFASILGGTTRYSKKTIPSWVLILTIPILIALLAYIYLSTGSQEVSNPENYIKSVTPSRITIKSIDTITSIKNLPIIYQEPMPLMDELAFSSFWIDEIKSNEVLQNNDSEGEYFIQFEVSETGVIIPLQVLSKNTCNPCKEELFEILLKTTPWKPAYIDGKPIAKQLYLPIKLKVNNLNTK